VTPAHEVRGWLAAAGQEARTPASEPIGPWITELGGMLVEPA
jgi:hypothetical protein